MKTQLGREDCDKCGKPNAKWKEQNFCDKCRAEHLKQIADAKAEQTKGVDPKFLKSSRLSAICDRELQRVGLADSSLLERISAAVYKSDLLKIAEELGVSDKPEYQNQDFYTLKYKLRLLANR